MAFYTRLRSAQAWYYGTLFLVGIYSTHMANATFLDIRPMYQEVEGPPPHSPLSAANINDSYQERLREHTESDREKAPRSASDSNTSKLQDTEQPHRHQKVGKFIALDAETRHINLGAMLDLEDIFGKKLGKGRRKNTDPFQIPLEREYVLDNLSMLKDMDGKVKNLCVEWIALIASKIKIDDKTPFRNIPDDTNVKTYDYLQHVWRNSKSNMVAEEDQLRKILGEYEATRRINALRHQLYRYTIARNWAIITNPHETKLLSNKYNHADFRMNNRQQTDFSYYFGLSIIPQKIDDRRLVKALRRKELSQTYRAALAAIFSETEAKRRVELDSYLANAIYEVSWWPLDFPKQCSINGLDCLSLVKVGDALQFGSNFLLESSSGVLSIDEAFSQVLSVMTDHSRPLPWNESPERAWLLAKYRDVYLERLKELSQYALHKAQRSLPLSIAKINEITNQQQLTPRYQVGYELKWCELGMDLKKLVHLMNLRNSSNNSNVCHTQYLAAEISTLSPSELDAFKAWHRDITSLVQNDWPSIADIFWAKMELKLISWSLKFCKLIFNNSYPDKSN